MAVGADPAVVSVLLPPLRVLALNNSPTRSPRGESPNDDVRRQLRQHFSHLSLLLSLVTAIINHYGHPTHNLLDVFQERMDSLYNQKPNPKVMEAALTVLICDKEILASMSYNTNSIVVVKETPGDHVQDFDVEPTPPVSPRRDDKFQCTLLTAGKNRWSAVQNDPTAGL